jgi:tetratricopeptide (TPR) repeat protein
VLLSRIGEAIIARQLGDLRRSERALEQILSDAMVAGDRDAQARAHHDLGAVYNDMGQGDRAIPHLYRAFELYERHEHKLRALSDMAEALKQAGRYEAARDAFMLVIAGRPHEEMRVCTMIGLLELSARMSDRVGFARWAREILAICDSLPAERAADFYLQLGLGSRAFGQVRSAQRFLRKALRIAERHNLHHYASRVRGALRCLGEMAAPDVNEAPPEATTSTVFAEIESKLHALLAS